MTIAEGSSAAAPGAAGQQDQRRQDQRAEHEQPADQHDRHALATVMARLGTAFPDVPPAELEAFILREYSRFSGSRIRSFVPLLVEHAVRDELHHTSAS
jgi:hypothetical protein